MYERHGITIEQATEALEDPDALIIDPDYASRSGLSTRTIGWCDGRAELLAVITIRRGRTTYGINAWPANRGDARRYREANTP